ncbi:MAG: family 16 glycosylhydrolase [Bacteroidetes bacterium]|jgi:beta-glucanase (GH16 family)|nr:family 16 glycosylhydrolase [Bacteroidota bacterium]
MTRISIIFLFLATLFIWSCEKEDNEFGEVTEPSGLDVMALVVGANDANPEGDGSGLVNFTATADNAITYKYVFSDGTTEIAPTGELEKRFTQVGVNTYSVTVIASGTGGVSTSTTIEVTVRSDFDDAEAVQFLTGGSSKTWYWAADEPGHLGVGQNDDNAEANYFANFYQATPFEKDGADESLCLYQDEMTFSLDGETLLYQLDNKGQTYFNAGYEDVVGGSAGFDFCYDFEVMDEPQVVTLAPSESVVVDNGVSGQTRGTVLNFSEGGFMSYYIGATRYEILSITENRLVVRAVQGNNDALAWYHIFSSTKPGTEDPGFDELVWSDEFDGNGAPNDANWGYNIGRGNNGWGNSEDQFYTDRSDNVRVEDGLLKITAKREDFSGAQYTSARITTEDKFEFTHGRVEVRAKLPTGGGTWPAIWLLGEDYATNTWPACGEIDIMEHVGNSQDEIFSSLHFPGNFAGDAVTRSTNVPGVSDEFHVYEATWTPDFIRFFVDGEEYHTFANNPDLPFDSDFFIILNVAMGGTFGGAIDPTFMESTMEVDYVRVYQ